MRVIEISLPYETAHILEVLAAKDGQRLHDGIATLLNHLANEYMVVKSANNGMSGSLK